MRRTLIVVIVVGLVLAAFWWLDFRIAASQNQVSSEVVTGSNAAAKEALSASGGRTLRLYVDGDDALSRSIEVGLANHPDLRPYFSQIDRVDSLSEVHDGYLLVIETGERDFLWTPVYGRAEMAAHLAFSSNGDVSWRGGNVFDMTNKEPTVMTKGTYNITDSTTGVISHKAYESHLGQRLAITIGKSLSEELKRLAPVAGGAVDLDRQDVAPI